VPGCAVCSKPQRTEWFFGDFGTCTSFPISIVIYVDGRREVAFSPLIVRLSARYPNNDAARITKLDKEMFHDESWKPVYCGVKRLKVQDVSRKNIACVSLHSCEYWLILVQPANMHLYIPGICTSGVNLLTGCT